MNLHIDRRLKKPDALTNVGKHVTSNIACARSQGNMKDSVFWLAQIMLVFLRLQNTPPFVKPNIINFQNVRQTSWRYIICFKSLFIYRKFSSWRTNASDWSMTLKLGKMRYLGGKNPKKIWTSQGRVLMPQKRGSPSPGNLMGKSR